MRRTFITILLAAFLLAASAGSVACQRMVEVQTGTRTVDSQGRVLSEDIHTLKVPVDTAGAYRVQTIVQPGIDPRIETLYSEAQAALIAGDYQLAGDKLGALLALTPDYRQATSQSDAIKAGKKPKPDNSPAPKPGTTTPSKTPTDTPSALRKWMPDTLTGFTAQPALVDAFSATRYYKPTGGTEAKSLSVYVEQYRSSAEAKKWLGLKVKRYFPKNADTFRGNNRNVYFGTDGDSSAAIGFASGEVLVAIQADVKSGDPKALRSTLEAVLKQLP
ncbi:MAG: hypothetical protein HGB10_10420 [Coriobacteriia bacterium]|nr:hypothetical protein [Coriobacteriia bacterium]